MKELCQLNLEVWNFPRKLFKSFTFEIFWFTYSDVRTARSENQKTFYNATKKSNDTTYTA